MAAGLEDLFGEEHPGEPDEAAGELRRALVVAAHPDDADFGAAGTSALLARAGWEVRYLVVTDGSKGSDELAATPEALSAAREREQRAAAELLGVSSVGLLGFTDGELIYSRELLGAITRELRDFRPFAVYTHDPEPVIIRDSFINHSDHRITGLATVDAVYPTARDRMNFPEQIEQGLQPHKVRELYLWGSNEPNFDVDITDLLETKIAALLAHQSQFGDGGGDGDEADGDAGDRSGDGGDGDGDGDFVSRMRDFWREPDGRSLERFRRVVLFR